MSCAFDRLHNPILPFNELCVLREKDAHFADHQVQPRKEFGIGQSTIEVYDVFEGMPEHECELVAGTVASRLCVQ